MIPSGQFIVKKRDVLLLSDPIRRWSGYRIGRNKLDLQRNAAFLEISISSRMLEYDLKPIKILIKRCYPDLLAEVPLIQTVSRVFLAFILWGAAIFETIVFLTLMGTAHPFDAAEIRYSEYRIVGTATQSMVTSTASGQSLVGNSP